MWPTSDVMEVLLFKPIYLEETFGVSSCSTCCSDTFYSWKKIQMLGNNVCHEIIELILSQNIYWLLVHFVTIACDILHEGPTTKKVKSDHYGYCYIYVQWLRSISKVLAGNSDVKSSTTFKAVIEVLKSCKQGASDQIFRWRLLNFFLIREEYSSAVHQWNWLTVVTFSLRFGPQCRVCMGEPQDPVELPCHHICCSTCIRASLDAGQTSCPMCRQELPNDFQPHVSEDIRWVFTFNIPVTPVKNPMVEITSFRIIYMFKDMYCTAYICWTSNQWTCHCCFDSHVPATLLTLLLKLVLNYFELFQIIFSNLCLTFFYKVAPNIVYVFTFCFGDMMWYPMLIVMQADNEF